MKTNRITRSLWAVLAVFVLLLSFSSPMPVSASMDTEMVSAIDLCPGGQPIVTQLYYDDFESGTASWTFEAITGASMWQLSDPNEDPASGEYALHAVPNASISDSYAAMTSSVDVPYDYNTYLYFAHDYGFEWGAGYYDGGVLEYSLDGGAWEDAGSLFSDGQNYGGTIGVAGYSNPLQERPGFVGESMAYTQSRYKLTLFVGHTITFRWRVGTDLGTPSPRGWYVDDVAIYTCEITSVDDIDYSSQYDNWVGVQDVQASGGGYRSASLAGQSIVYKTAVATNSFNLLTYVGPDQGKAQVVVDGKNVKSLDLYSANPAYTSVLISGLRKVKHTITVKVLGTKNTLSTGTNVRVDGFVVGATTIDDNNVGVKYSKWAAKASTSALGGSYRSSGSKNSKVTIPFVGASFTWITSKAKNYGKASIYLDGVFQQTVDLYSASTVWQYEVTISGLSYGSHTAEIVVLGTRNSKSRGTTVVFDGYLAR